MAENETPAGVGDVIDGAEAAGGDDPFESEEVQSFDRSYVQKLRQEAAAHRTAKQTYEKAFEGWTPDDREVWLDTIQLSVQNPQAAAERLRQIAGLLSPEEVAELEAETQKGNEGSEEPEFMTKAEFERRYKEERETDEVERQVRIIQDEAQLLGYKVGSSDYFELMWHANNETNGDLNKAHEAVEAKRQKIIDEYLEQKRNQSSGPVTSRRGGVPVSQEKPVKTFAEAREALEQYIASNK